VITKNQKDKIATRFFRFVCAPRSGAPTAARPVLRRCCRPRVAGAARGPPRGGRPTPQRPPPRGGGGGVWRGGRGGGGPPRAAPASRSADKTKKPRSGFILSIFSYLLSAACYFSHRLPSGAALVQAAPLVHLPATLPFSHQPSPKSTSPAPLVHVPATRSFRHRLPPKRTRPTKKAGHHRYSP
jgi:hypothetical protein